MNGLGHTDHRQKQAGDDANRDAGRGQHAQAVLGLEIEQPETVGEAQEGESGESGQPGQGLTDGVIQGHTSKGSYGHGGVTRPAGRVPSNDEMVF